MKSGLKKLKSSSLYQTLLLALVISTLLLLPQYLLKQSWELEKNRQQYYKLIDAIESALELALNHNQLDTTFNFEHKEVSEYTVGISSKPWGCFKIVNLFAKDSAYNFVNRTYLVNDPLTKLRPQPNLYIQRSRNSIDLEDSVILKGAIYLNVEDETGDRKKGAMFFEPKSFLPELSNFQAFRWSLDYLIQQYPNSQIESFEPNTNYKQDFLNEPRLVYLEKTDTLKECLVEDNVIVISSQALHIENTAQLNRCLIWAPSCSFGSSFKGSVHMVCKDSIYLDSGVTLSQSSLIINNASQGALVFGKSVSVEGNILLYNPSGTKSCICVFDPTTEFKGQVYAEGPIQLQGLVKGSILAAGTVVYSADRLKMNYLEKLTLRPIDKPEGNKRNLIRIFHETR